MATAKKTTKRKPKKVTFMSRFPDLTLTRIPEDYILDARGAVIGKQKPEPDESPWSYSFDNSILETSDPVAIEFIREHELFNRDIWEAGAAPDEPKPTNAEQMAIISQAAATRDVEAIEALIEDEKNNHDRLPIIQAAEAALSALEGLPTELGGGSGEGEIPSDSTHSDED
jgi:hypothetical protein